MKTLSRMVRRYILAAFGIVLLIFFVNAALFLGVVLHYGLQQQEDGYLPVSKLAASFRRTADGGYQLDPQLEWQNYFDWAMLLDNGGEILWSEQLPEKLNHRYTVPEVASFSRWYLEDYPVMVYRNDYGLLVAGMPIGSMTRFDFYLDSDILNTFLRNFVPLLALDAGILLAVCLLLGWRGAKPLRKLARGIDELAEGRTVALEERGATAELAQKLNRTSRHLQQQNERIAQRDAARTNWIAGVSHDIRTPLALIMGYSEQLEHMQMDPDARSKAASIRLQSQRIKTLIQDLNLTSKLQYNSQPLRMKRVQAGPMLRACVANFSNGLEDGPEIGLTVSEAVEQTLLEADEALLERAVENLLNNSVRHNPAGCEIRVGADVAGGRLVITVQDTGAGYPEAVLAELNRKDTQPQANGPHILGLHLVQQIVQAHGGTVAFQNDHGAAAVIRLKIPEPQG